MPYREKVAWLSLIAMVVAFVPYFGFVAINKASEEALPSVRQLALFAAAAVVQMLILGGGHVILRRGAPEEAGMPPDERDRAIMSRSILWAYYVLVAGMILVGCVMPLSSSGWAIINAAIFTIIVAEVVHHGVVVASYRRHAWPVH